jgi:hypothetical protein
LLVYSVVEMSANKSCACHKSEVHVHSDEYYKPSVIQINNTNCETSSVDVCLSDLVHALCNMKQFFDLLLPSYGFILK